MFRTAGATELAAAQTPAPGADDIPEAAKVVKVRATATTPKPISAERYAEIAKKSGDPLTKQEYEAAVQAAGCWEHQVRKWGENVFGADLWKYFQEIGWCGDGQWITSTPKADAWGSVHWPGWTYTGRDTIQKSYGVDWNIWEVASQGHFCYLDVDQVGCAQSQDPRIFQQGHGDGGIYWE
jgi:hypothetical protein